MRCKPFQRRGVTTVQYCVMAAVIALGVIATVIVLGNRTNTKLGQTATDMANPQSLTTRFGS
jgi:Flp pilus assembly pilin Flp